ncbi:MAG: hypothetical protein F6J93_00210 [Oscillatoria sp. SIO1A7]|nr:hypothetical protein [Oscillatoria sp. SIO1A7]
MGIGHWDCGEWGEGEGWEGWEGRRHVFLGRSIPIEEFYLRTKFVLGMLYIAPTPSGYPSKMPNLKNIPRGKSPHSPHSPHLSPHLVGGLPHFPHFPQSPQSQCVSPV